MLVDSCAGCVTELSELCLLTVLYCLMILSILLNFEIESRTWSMMLALEPSVDRVASFSEGIWATKLLTLYNFCVDPRVLNVEAIFLFVYAMGFTIFGFLFVSTKFCFYICEVACW